MLADRYRLVRRQIERGIGATWIAADTETGSDVWVQFADDGGLAETAALVQELEHPGVPRVLDTGELRMIVDSRAVARKDGEQAAYATHVEIVIEFVVLAPLTGRALPAKIVRRALAPAEALAIAALLAGALGLARARGHSHGWLTADSVWLVRRGGCVADLALGLAFPDGSQVDVEQAVTGYFAAERLAGGPASEAADVYALGWLLYEMLIGHAALQAEYTRLVEGAGAVTTSELLALWRTRARAHVLEILAADSALALLLAACLAEDAAARPGLSAFESRAREAAVSFAGVGPLVEFAARSRGVKAEPAEAALAGAALGALAGGAVAGGSEGAGSTGSAAGEGAAGAGSGDAMGAATASDADAAELVVASAIGLGAVGLAAAGVGEGALSESAATAFESGSASGAQAAGDAGSGVGSGGGTDVAAAGTSAGSGTGAGESGAEAVAAAAGTGAAASSLGSTAIAGFGEAGSEVGGGEAGGGAGAAAEAVGTGAAASGARHGGRRRRVLMGVSLAAGIGVFAVGLGAGFAWGRHSGSAATATGPAAAVSSLTAGPAAAGDVAVGAAASACATAAVAVVAKSGAALAAASPSAVAASPSAVSGPAPVAAPTSNSEAFAQLDQTVRGAVSSGAVSAATGSQLTAAISAAQSASPGTGRWSAALGALSSLIQGGNAQGSIPAAVANQLSDTLSFLYGAGGS